ncbi:hypothetical protein BVX95_00275 [archaeon D22]|nr:hypothetical protein BVX95_00275 [archaeon D22]
MQLIDAARQAPSGHNTQSWKFKIVEPKDYDKIEGMFVQDFVLKAPMIILCAANPLMYKKTDNDQDNQIRAIRDLSISTAFLTLRAEELGLGTCYVGWVDREKIKLALDIPAEYVVPYVITVGYPKEKRNRSPKKEVEEILF